MKTRKYLERMARSTALMLGELISTSDADLEKCIDETEAFELKCQLGNLLEELQNVQM